MVDITYMKLDKTDPKYVALLSGLNIGADDQLDMRTQLLAEFLGGELGSSADEVSSSKISRVILAGNSIIKPATKKEIKKVRHFNVSIIWLLNSLFTEKVWL